MSTGEGGPHQGSAGVGVPLAAAPPSGLGDNWDTQRLGSCQKSSGQSPQKRECSSLERDIMQIGLQVIKEGRGWDTAEGRSWAGEAWTAGPPGRTKRSLAD